MTQLAEPSPSQRLLDRAAAAARAAGGLLVAGRPAGRVAAVQTKSSPSDIVTELDRESERLIVQRLRAGHPDDAVLAEEGGAARGTSGVRWIIDPIDGTVNFSYGLPDWAVSIAAEVDGEVEAGVVYVVPRGEMFTAVRGGGARLDGRPIRCNTGVALAGALVATGFGYTADRRSVQAEVLRTVLPRVRDIRRSGAAAVDLCSVAAGRVDAFYERGLQRWDLAAASLIATEAGAVVGGLRGGPAGPDFTIAAARDLFDPLHEMLVALEPDRDTAAPGPGHPHGPSTRF